MPYYYINLIAIEPYLYATNLDCVTIDFLTELSGSVGSELLLAEKQHLADSDQQ
jgi:hypothetical protein